MTVDEILAEIDDHGFTDTSSLRKVSKLNQTYHGICARTSWPFLATSLSLTFNGTSEIPTNTPADLKSVLSARATNASLEHARIDSLRRSYDTLTTQGEPMYFYFVGNSLRIFPVPSASTTVMLDYIRRPASLAVGGTEASILIPKDHHGLLVDGTLYRLYIMEDDPELASFFRDEFNHRLVELYSEFRQQFVTPDKVHVTDPEDYNYYYPEIY